MSSIVEDKGFAFSLNVISFIKNLRNHKEFVFANQLLRSASSIGANVREAGAGQSKRDFMAKMSIASKGARETRYSLRWIKG